MQTITATNARQAFFDLIKNTNEQHEVFRIQHRKGSAVLLSEADYENLIESLELLSIPAFRKSLAKSVEQAKKGETYSMDEIFGKDD